MNIGIKNPGDVLPRLGYNLRPKVGDWLREDQNGRFHAICKLSRFGKKVVNFHYDLYVDGKIHVSGFDLPYHMGVERARIQSFLSRHGKNIKSVL